MIDKTEKRILRALVTAVAHHNENAWWELKRSVFEYGYQSYYPAESFFENAARQSLTTLSEFERRKLIQLWRLAKPGRPTLNDDEIMSRYVKIIIEQVVSRASSAAYRTVDW